MEKKGREERRKGRRKEGRTLFLSSFHSPVSLSRCSLVFSLSPSLPAFLCLSFLLFLFLSIPPLLRFLLVLVFGWVLPSFQDLWVWVLRASRVTAPRVLCPVLGLCSGEPGSLPCQSPPSQRLIGLSSSTQLPKSRLHACTQKSHLAADSGGRGLWGFLRGNLDLGKRFCSW